MRKQLEIRGIKKKNLRVEDFFSQLLLDIWQSLERIRQSLLKLIFLKIYFILIVFIIFGLFILINFFFFFFNLWRRTKHSPWCSCWTLVLFFASRCLDEGDRRFYIVAKTLRDVVVKPSSPGSPSRVLRDPRRLPDGRTHRQINN